MVTVGIDEVGRGCWAGPLVAAAVILPPNLFWEDCPPKGGATVLRDSKKLSKNQRKILAGHIKSQAIAYGVGWVTPGEVDEFGLTQSVRLAMLRAIKKLHETTTEYDEIIIDGNYNFFADRESSDLSRLYVKGRSFHVRAVVRADDTVPAVSTASILAKVARDDYMAQMSHKYSGYGFEKHVGYGTAAHVAALSQYGITDLHRKSFRPIRAYLADRDNLA